MSDNLEDTLNPTAASVLGALSRLNRRDTWKLFDDQNSFSNGAQIAMCDMHFPLARIGCDDLAPGKLASDIWIEVLLCRCDGVPLTERILRVLRCFLHSYPTWTRTQYDDVDAFKSAHGVLVLMERASTKIPVYRNALHNPFAPSRNTRSSSRRRTASALV